MAQPDSAGGRLDAFRDGIAVVLTAIAFLGPPDNYPETRVPLLLGAALALAVNRGRSIAGAALLATFVLWSAGSLSWSASLARGCEALAGLVLAAALFLTTAAADGRYLGVVASMVALAHGASAALQRWVTLPALTEQLQAGDAGFAPEVLLRASGGRAFSTFALPGHLGALLAALVPILVAQAASGASRVRRWLALAGLVGVAVGLYAAAALGSLLALVAVGLGYVAFSAFRARAAGRTGSWLGQWPEAVRRPVLLATVLGIALGLGIVSMRLPDLLDTASTDNPAVTRLRLWSRSLEVVRSAPVTGVGLGSHGIAWTPFLQPTDVPTRHAHMSYIELAAEVGLVGLGLFVLFVADVLGRPRAVAPALAAWILLVHAAADFDLQAAGLLAATFALLGHAARSGDARDRPIGRGATVAAGLVLAATVAFVVVSGRRSIPRPSGGDSAASEAAPASAAAGGGGLWALDAAGHAAHARAMLESKHLDEALASCRAARRLEPSVAAHAALEAQIRLLRGEPLGAFFAYDDAVFLRPGQPAYVEPRDRLLERLAAGYTAPGAGDP